MHAKLLRMDEDKQCDQDHTQHLCERAEQGDQGVLPELRRYLDAHPGIWRHYGDLARQAESSLIHLAAGENLLLQESLQRKLEEMKQHLAGVNPTALELLLVQRIGCCWLEASYFSTLLGQSTNTDLARLANLRKHLDSANRRYLASIKHLVVVRKLLAQVPSALEMLRQPQGDVPPPGNLKRRSRRDVRVSP